VAEYADHVSEALRDDLMNKINSLNYYDAAAYYDNEVINNAVRDAIEGLPPRCRQVFLYSRRDHLKNAEIAERMGISENTVEAQMTIAFRKLRIALSPFLPQTSKKQQKTTNSDVKESGKRPIFHEKSVKKEVLPIFV
jgi:RNA polymerase sigma-70 factor (ECF subfamily)